MWNVVRAMLLGGAISTEELLNLSRRISAADWGIAMWIRSLAVLLALTLGHGTASSSEEPDDVKQAHDFIRALNAGQDEKNAQQLLGVALLAATLVESKTEAESAAANAVVPKVTVFPLTNEGATLQPGEPTENHLMTRTIWGTFKAPDAARIVIHTFGSDINTVLAVYRGTAIENLTRVVGNDNTPLPGVGNAGSLVQFNTIKDADYAVQIGSRANAEGEISLNVFKLPPAGGLAALLFQYEGKLFNGRDYTCADEITCPPAKFIIYNSTDKTLTVTPSTTLGAGVTSVAPFQLAARALKVVEFKFGAGFSHAARIQVGKFVFTGRVNGTVVTEASARAMIVYRPHTRIDDMVRAQVTPTFRTGYVNAPFAFTAKLTNTSASTAVGCHFRSTKGSYVKSTFYEINPANGSRLGADDTPSNIAAGQSRTFKVTIASQTARDGDHIDPDVIADCANNSRRKSPLRGGFDISTSGYYTRLPSLSVTSSVPSNDILSIPKGRYRYYTFRVTNTQTTRMLDVLPAYVGPFDDPANRTFGVAICQTNLSTGKCLAPFARSVTYTAKRTGVFGFSVRVKAPLVATPLDADKRRVYINFKRTDAPYFHIAAPSIAVRAQ